MDFKFDIENIKWQKGSYGLPEPVLKIKIPSVSVIIGSEIPDPEWDEFVAQVGKEKAEQIMTSAGHRGSAMHVFIENFIKIYKASNDVSEALRVTQEASPELLRKDGIPNNKIDEGRSLFYKFYYSDYSQQYYDMIASELGIYSPTLFYRGKLDLLYRDKVLGLSLVDFKSSNGKIKKGSTKELKYKYQLGGYANCIDEMYKEKGIIINRAAILCIDKKDDILQEIELVGKELQEYKEKFKTICIDYHIKNNTKYLIEHLK